jgi:hypothetical protein
VAISHSWAAKIASRYQQVAKLFAFSVQAVYAAEFCGSFNEYVLETPKEYRRKQRNTDGLKKVDGKYSSLIS